VRLGHTRSVFVRTEVVAAVVEFNSMPAEAHLN
jgi:hypothetical protein